MRESGGLGVCLEIVGDLDGRGANVACEILKMAMSHTSLCH